MNLPPDFNDTPKNTDDKVNNEDIIYYSNDKLDQKNNNVDENDIDL